MALGGREIYDMITELEQPFKTASVGKDLRTRADNLRRIEDSLYDYSQHISPTLTNPISLHPSTLRHERNGGVAALSTSLRVHLEPRGGLQRHETAADRLEVAEAHLLLEVYEPFRDAVHQKQMMGPFWAGWLLEGDFEQPDQADGETDEDYVKRLKNARSGHMPWAIKECDIASVSYMEADRELTAGGLRFKLPIIEMMERFSDVSRTDEKGMLSLWTNTYGWLAEDHPQPKDDPRDIWRSMVEIVVVADRNEISYAIERPAKQGRTNAGRMRGIGETTYDNPFGQVPLLLAEGVYLSDRTIAYRREGLMHAKIEVEHGKSIIRSDWASTSSSAPEYVENKLPQDMTVDQFREMGQLVDENGRLLRRSTKGEMQILERPVDAQQDKLFQTLENDSRLVSVRGLLMDSEGEVSSVGVSVHLKAVDDQKQMLGSATRSEVRLANRLLDMIEHSMQVKRNKHRSKGQPAQTADWPLGFNTSGLERVKGRVVKHGETVEVKPQDLDLDMTRTIEPVDERLSTQEALLRYWTARYQADLCEYDEMVAGIGQEDVEGYKERKTAEKLVAMDTPRLIMDARAKYAEVASIRQGRSLQEITAEIAVEPVVEPVMDGDGGTGGISRFASPATEPLVASGGSSQAT